MTVPIIRSPPYAASNVTFSWTQSPSDSLCTSVAFSGFRSYA